jgi:hypothetical protein
MISAKGFRENMQKRYEEGTHVVIIDPDVAKSFSRHRFYKSGIEIVS